MTLAVNIAQSGSNNVTFRNKLINGNMVIDQRNAGASVSVTTTNVYLLDRWKIWANGGGGTGANFTVQQSSTAPTGFSNSTSITVAGTSTVSGTVYNVFAQVIEGYNVADLNWGATAASAGQTAKPITLSFWVRSSLTGTFGGALNNSAQDRSYPFTYTINSANTWEQKSITVAGDTSGTWLTTNGIGLSIFWSFGTGSSYSGTAGAWAGTVYLSATGTTNLVGTNGATFYITGVQLEAGTTASPFEYRQYGTELQLCQRYYQQIGGSTYGVAYQPYSMGSILSSTQVSCQFPVCVTMRSTPTFGFNGATSTLVRNGSGGAITPSSVVIDISSPTMIMYNCIITGGTAGNGSSHYQNAGSASTSSLTLSAEL